MGLGAAPAALGAASAALGAPPAPAVLGTSPAGSGSAAGIEDRPQLRSQRAHARRERAVEGGGADRECVGASCGEGADLVGALDAAGYEEEAVGALPCC